ncbi:class I SAM-dependent methyltransferase [Amycolatopsis cihanbeyliensis]|uniref:class I SAM-dependent methyltransferase n=1 Tax=Amycolatopsis cihanbeyliensis TaxID=1128664 RepID=UPI00115491DD|nr:class I SAM-dependent methyltransferase [Amycolatopsis cihanbeyliensis]
MTTTSRCGPIPVPGWRSTSPAPRSNCRCGAEPGHCAAASEPCAPPPHGTGVVGEHDRPSGPAAGSGNAEPCEGWSLGRNGVVRYVILGAGLDIFVQRRPEFAGHLRVFELDQPGAQEWKHQRLIELGYGIPDWLRLVPADFDGGGSWWEQLCDAGFPTARNSTCTPSGLGRGCRPPTAKTVVAKEPFVSQGILRPAGQRTWSILINLLPADQSSLVRSSQWHMLDGRPRRSRPVVSLMSDLSQSCLGPVGREQCSRWCNKESDFRVNTTGTPVPRY